MAVSKKTDLWTDNFWKWDCSIKYLEIILSVKVSSSVKGITHTYGWSFIPLHQEEQSIYQGFSHNGRTSWYNTDVKNKQFLILPWVQ